MKRTVSLTAGILCLVALASCNTGSQTTVPVSDPQAKIAQSDVPDNMLALLTALRASSGTLPALILKSDVTVAKPSFCNEKGLPSVTAPTASGTLQASDVKGGVSGSCAYTAQVDDTASEEVIAAVLNCKDMKIGDPLDGGGTQVTTFNGKLGFEGTLVKSGGQESGNIESSSADLTVQIDAQTVCVAGVNMGLGVTLDSTTGESVTVDGCMQICKQIFSFSGTE